jgi:hypothetical protein
MSPTAGSCINGAASATYGHTAVASCVSRKTTFRPRYVAFCKGPLYRASMLGEVKMLQHNVTAMSAGVLISGISACLKQEMR